ncbi:hypothetical protein LEMLEM_LOCUS11782 [Lemmus lemmus]
MPGVLMSTRDMAVKLPDGE